MDKKYTLIIFAVIIVSFIFSGFCLWKWKTDKTSSAEIKGLQESAENYKKEKDDLIAENETIKAENETIKAENENLYGKTGSLSAKEVSDKVMSYVNKNLLQPGSTAVIISVGSENNLYKIRAKIQGTEYDLYATKDGKLFFPSSFNLDEKITNSTDSTGTSKKTCEDLKKIESATLEAFIVSKCPYGLQMQRILNEIVKNIPSLTENIKVRYMGSIESGKITSMHGDNEAQENLRQICIREEQSTKYWDYVACYIKKGETANCLTSSNIDQTGLSVCMTNIYRGLEYAKNDFDSQNDLGVTGSPTLFLNGEKVSEFDFGGRTAEAVKTALCCGFNAAPSVCSKKLTETSAATAFSETYASSSGSSSGGDCGQ